MEIALGHLGWSEREYYESSPAAFYYAVKGYFSKMRMKERWFRVIAYNTFRLAGGKESNINNYWKIDDEVKPKGKINAVMSKEVFDSIMSNLKR